MAQLLKAEAVVGVEVESAAGLVGFAVPGKKQNIPGLMPELFANESALGLGEKTNIGSGNFVEQCVIDLGVNAFAVA